MVADEVVLAVEEERPNARVQNHPQLFGHPKPVPSAPIQLVQQTQCQTTEQTGETPASGKRGEGIRGTVKNVAAGGSRRKGRFASLTLRGG